MGGDGTVGLDDRRSVCCWIISTEVRGLRFLVVDVALDLVTTGYFMAYGRNAPTLLLRVTGILHVRLLLMIGVLLLLSPTVPSLEPLRVDDTTSGLDHHVRVGFSILYQVLLEGVATEECVVKSGLKHLVE
jgi:hypothetical protein